MENKEKAEDCTSLDPSVETKSESSSILETIKAGEALLEIIVEGDGGELVEFPSTRRQ